MGATEYNILGSSGYFGNIGGLSVVSRAITRKDVKEYFGDTRVAGAAGVHTLKDEVRRTVRSVLLNPQWIDDNGEKQEVEWSYDADNKQMTVTSTHHSVYAVLPAENPDDTNMGYLMGAFIAAMAVIFCLIVRSKKA